VEAAYYLEAKPESGFIWKPSKQHFDKKADMTRDREAFWFPAKRYGWGWGPPKRWQGWLVLMLYFLLIALCAAFFLRHDRVAAFLSCTAILTGALLLVCWIKGERPQWRW
jgi:hypothetical protein